MFKKILKYLFTINKKHKTKLLSKTNHFKYRIILIVLFLPLLYILLFSYVREDFTLLNILKTIMFLLFFRFFAKDMTDSLFIMFFHKSSYKVKPLTLKQKRLKKLKKLKK